MELLSALNLEQLGTAGVMLGYVIYQNHCLRKDLVDEKEYSRKEREIFQELAHKTIETMGKMEQAFMLLKDGLK